MRIPQLTPASNVASDDILLLEQKTTATSGTLVVGTWYLISTLESGDNFTNVGYLSAGVWFKATATTPTTWTNSTAVVSYTSKSVTPQQLSGGGAKRFLCLLNQTSTNAPTMTILINDLGGTPVWSYIDVGNYLMTLTGAFVGDKVRVIPPTNPNNLIDWNVYSAGRNNDNSIFLTSAILTATPTIAMSDELLYEGLSFLEILIYP
jgi:hypothetical protein